MPWNIFIFMQRQNAEQKQPGGLFSARVGAWLHKKNICCEQQKNVEILMVLQHCSLRNSLKSAQLQWAEKNVTKTLLFAWNCNMSTFFGPWKWGSFFEAFFVSLWYRCIFVALFVKSTFGTCTVNTNYITGLDMCRVCTEAVHSVALWARVTSQVWTCKVCTEAVHSVALWTRVTSQVWTCVEYVPKQSIP